MSSSATSPFAVGNSAVAGGYKKPKDEEEAMSLMAALRSRAENKKCFDCPASTPEWCSIPFGIFLCLECCGRHRGMGVHISFMKSATMDAWRPDEAFRMSKGGNGAAAEYFRQHGLNEAKNRYTSMAAQMYKKRLDKLVADAESGREVLSASRSDTASPNTPTAVTTEFVASPLSEKPSAGSTTIHTFNHSSGAVSPTSPTPEESGAAPIAISTTKVTLVGKKPAATGKTALAKKKGLGGGLGLQKVEKLEEASGPVASKSLIGEEDETAVSEPTNARANLFSDKEAPMRVRTLNGGYTTAPTTTAASSFSNNGGSSSSNEPAPTVYRTGGSYTGGGPDYGGIGSTPANRSGGGGGDGFREAMFGFGQTLASMKRKANELGNAAAQMLDEA